MLISLKFPRASYMPFPKTETMSNLWDFFTSWVLEHRLFTLPALASWVLLWPKFWIALCSSWHTALPVAIPSHPPNPPMLPVVFLTTASDTLQQPCLLKRREGGIPGFPAPGAASFLWEAQGSPSKYCPAWLCLPRGVVCLRERMFNKSTPRK